MSRIDHKNVDEYLFNFFEGNLSSDETNALTDFLNKNPALKADYDAWKNSYVEEPPMVYPNMNTLLKPVAASFVKWVKWFVVLFIGISLPLIYSLSQDNIDQLPASSLKQQSGADVLRKGKIPVPAETEKTERKRPAIHLHQESSKTALQSNDTIRSNPFMRMTKLTLIPIQSVNSPPDSLDIILKKQESAPKIKSRSKSKRKEQEMKMIRLNNTGF